MRTQKKRARDRSSEVSVGSGVFVLASDFHTSSVIIRRFVEEGGRRERPRLERAHPARATAEAPNSGRAPRARVDVGSRAPGARRVSRLVAPRPERRFLGTRDGTSSASPRRRPTSRRVDPPVVSRSNDACTDGARRQRRLPRRLSTPAWAPPPPRATSRASREMCRPPARERAASP